MYITDLRLHPLWRPERAHWTCGPWSVDLWSEPRLPDEENFDDHLIAHRPGVVRLAALDAVVNVANPGGREAAIRGVRVTRSRLRTDPGTLSDALLGASRELCDEAMRPRHRNPGLTAAAADLHRDAPVVDVAVAADAQVWVRTGGRWSSPWDVDMLTVSARAAWQAARTELLAPVPAFLTQERLLDDPQAWAYPYLGLVPSPALRTGRVSEVEEVIVTTDGAQLTAERCADLLGWLAGGLQQRAPGSVYPSPHGDVTVLHARFTAPGT